jgi:single-strand DNA-binding protein
MAQGDTPITLVGNLTADPELRYTPNGVAVAKFTVASTPRSYDREAGEWKDGATLFLTCSSWRQAAENVTESLEKGMRVIVHGRLRQRSYEAQDGSRRTVYEVEADEVGPSLRNASAKVSRAGRSGPGAPGQAAGHGDGSGHGDGLGGDGGPWAGASAGAPGTEPPF